MPLHVAVVSSHLPPGDRAWDCVVSWAHALVTPRCSQVSVSHDRSRDTDPKKSSDPGEISAQTLMQKGNDLCPGILSRRGCMLGIATKLDFDLGDGVRHSVHRRGHIREWNEMAGSFIGKMAVWKWMSGCFQPLHYSVRQHRRWPYSIQRAGNQQNRTVYLFHL